MVYILNVILTYCDVTEGKNFHIVFIFIFPAPNKVHKPQ